MSDPATIETLAHAALARLHAGEPDAARVKLEQALELAPERPDLLHAMGVVHLHLGEPPRARGYMERAIERAQLLGAADPERRETAEAMIVGFRVGLAAVLEELDEPVEAERAYRAVLARVPDHAEVRASLGHLLLAWGRADEATTELRRALAGADGALREGLTAFLADLDRFRASGTSPRAFLDAHRGGYVEFFDHHARDQEAKGWIAEAARMYRDASGQVVPLIPEGARPYAAVRVDLVDPRTSQVGQVGDEPMVVGLAAAPLLAKAPVVLPLEDAPVPTWVSSQAPWDQLPVQVLLADKTGALAVDTVIGAWYRAGFDGAFGTPTGQRFHYVSDPELRRRGTAVVYHVDCGRAEVRAVDDLLRRLAVFHEHHPVRAVLLGRGHLPG